MSPVRAGYQRGSDEETAWGNPAGGAGRGLNPHWGFPCWGFRTSWLGTARFPILILTCIRSGAMLVHH